MSSFVILGLANRSVENKVRVRVRVKVRVKVRDRVRVRVRVSPDCCSRPLHCPHLSAPRQPIISMM